MIRRVETPPILLDDQQRAQTECRLLTTGRQSGQPHEVRVWFAAEGSTVFVLAGGGEQSDWVRNLRADPRVTVRLGGMSLPGRARFVAGTADDTRAREAVAAKYGTKWLTAWLRDSLAVAIDLEAGLR